MNIKDLLASLAGKKYQDIAFDYDYNNYKSDTSSIFKMQDEKDVVGLLDFWKEKVKHNSFSLSHPTEPVITHAVYNVQLGMANFVFMMDDEGGNAWIFAQCEFLINLFIVENGIYKNAYGNMGPVFSQIKTLAGLNVSDLDLKKREFGFLLSQTRPYHFFYDHLKIFKSIPNVKPVSLSESFFFPKESVFFCDGVYVFPSAIGNNYINQKGSFDVKRMNSKMEEEVYKESIEGGGKVIGDLEKSYDLVLWLGITGQKRSWLQQVDGYAEIVKQFKKNFGAIKVYIDGMTASDGGNIRNPEDEAVFSEIKNLLLSYENIEIISLVGMDYRTKICHCEKVDFFIANAGTGCMVPLRFNKKPGVLHSNSRIFTFPDSYSESVKIFDKKFEKDVVDDLIPQAMFSSYHIPWQHIFNLASELVNNIKGSSVEPLVVPSVVELSNCYAEDKKDELSALKNLKSRMKPSHQSPDILREVALAFEESGDFSTALVIMEKALELRPTGALIKGKVEEYKFLLSQGDG